MWKKDLPQMRALLILPLFLAQPMGAQTPDNFEQDVAASDPLRTAQAQELDAYIENMNRDETRLQRMFHPDYRSRAAFVASTQALRKAFAASIGYPPPGPAATDGARFERLGEDFIGTYYRAFIPVVHGVHAEGNYIVPRGVAGRVPLVIAMHGGRGSPEVALFHGGGNYHDMVRGGVKRGYAVFAPQHLFQGPSFPEEIRDKIDRRLRLIGTSLTAIEIAKINRSLDVLLARPEIDATRVAMVGLSYGGYYTLG